MWSYEMEPWFHSWYRGRVETLGAKAATSLALVSFLVQRKGRDLRCKGSYFFSHGFILGAEEG